MNDTLTPTFTVPGHPELDVVERQFPEGGSATASLGNPPWDSDEDLRHRLEDAGWRYARLIGIVEPNDEAETAQREADQLAHSALIRTVKGAPEWHCREATTFTSELVGCSREIAAGWLNLDWFGGGEV